MTSTTYVVTIRDAVTGQQVGSLAKYGGIYRESVTGFGVGTASPLVTISHIRDVVTGWRVGSFLSTISIEREVLAGEDVGLDLFPQMMSVVREVLGRDTSYKFQTIVRETLAASVGEWTTLAWETRTSREIVAQRRPTMELPPVVWSQNQVPAYRQVVLQRNKRKQPISAHRLHVLSEIALQERGVLAPPGVASTLRTGAFKQIALQSRSIPYVPASGIFALTVVAKILQRRTVLPPPAVLAPVTTFTQAQIALQSRRDNSRYAATLAEIVLIERLVQFSAPTDYAGLIELAVQRRVNPMWHSNASVAVLAQITAAHRDTEIPLSTTTVASYNQVAVQHIERPWWNSTTVVASAHSIALQEHNVIRYYSGMEVATAHQVVVAKRTLGPMPPTALYAKTLRRLSVHHRDTLIPSKISWWYTRTTAQIALQANLKPFPVQYTEVATLRVQYLLGANYPLPGDVMGPENGASIVTLREIAAQERIVESPHVVNESRFVFNVLQQLAVHEVYQDTDIAASDAIVFTLGQQVVTPDSYDNPRLPLSDAIVSTLGQVVVAGDEFPDPRVPLSDAVVTALASTVVMGATDYPDPLFAASDATVTSLAQFAVLGDDSYLDPTQSLAEVKTFVVTSPVVILDDSYPPPSDAMSNAEVFNLGEFIILVDRSLYGIPKRTDRRRPIVSISIT